MVKVNYREILRLNSLRYSNTDIASSVDVLPEDYDFESHKELVPMQPGDVPMTYADTSALERNFGFKPSTMIILVKMYLCSGGTDTAVPEERYRQSGQRIPL